MHSWIKTEKGANSEIAGTIKYQWTSVFIHPGYLYNTTKGIAATSLDCFDTSNHSFTSLLLRISITNLGSVMPFKSPTCFPNLSDQRDSVLLHSPRKVGWEFLDDSPNSSSTTLFLRQLCSIKQVYFLEYALFQRISKFLKVFFSNIHWFNCLWSFKSTHVSKSQTKYLGLESYRPRAGYTMCAVQASLISFSGMKCLEQFTRGKNPSLRYKWIQFNTNKANTSDAVRSCQAEWKSRIHYL